MYERTYGPKYRDLGEYPTAAQIAKAVRQDIKAADKAGDLPAFPAGVKFAVTCQNFAGGCSVDVNVKQAPEDWAWTEIPEGWRRYPTETKRISDELQALAKALDVILNAYNRDGSEIQVDYFDVRYYASVYLGEYSGGGLVLA
jgi:hypothetical protein